MNLAFEATDRVAVEGRGLSSMQRVSGKMGLEATGTMLFTIARGPKAAPYAAIGGGVYRASFDLGNQAMFGALGSQFGPGTMMVPIQGTSGFGMMGDATGFSGDVLTGWNGPPSPAVTCRPSTRTVSDSCPFRRTANGACDRSRIRP